MSSNQTKILIAVILGVALILGSYGVYRYFSNSPATTPASTTGDTAGSFPVSGGVTSPNGEVPTTIKQTVPKSTTDNAGGSSSGGPTSALAGQADISTIKIVADKPSSGGIFIENLVQANTSTSSTKKLFTRYMERESGHIYDLALNENIPKKVTNTTITKVYETYFNNTGKSLLIRGLDDAGGVQNILATMEEPVVATTSDVATEVAVGKLTQSLLPYAIREVAVSPNKAKIFYLTEAGGDYIGTTEDFGAKVGANKKQVFSSALGEWQIQWPEANTLFFNTKPAASVGGFLYSESLTNLGLNKVLGDINGLTSSASPDAKKLIYSESVEGGIKTYIYDLVKKESNILSLVTLPEKCIWGGVEKDIIYCAVPTSIPTGEYPDIWYQGSVSFNDELWMIDTRTGNTQLLIDKATLEKTTKGVDATNLVLSPNEDYLLFTNKKDSSIWQVRLK